MAGMLMLCIFVLFCQSGFGSYCYNNNVIGHESQCFVGNVCQVNSIELTAIVHRGL